MVQLTFTLLIALGFVLVLDYIWLLVGMVLEILEIDLGNKKVFK